MKKRLLSLVIATIVVLFTVNIMAQVGINTDGSDPDPSAMLDVKSTSKGFLPPRMTLQQMNGIITPPEGLIVYNTTSNALYWYNGVKWKKFNEMEYTETDPVFITHPAYSISLQNMQEWSTAFSWGNHAGLYEPLISKSPGYAKWTGTSWNFSNDTYSLSNHNHDGAYDTYGAALWQMGSHNWAYNHENIALGVTAYGWGNHATAGYLTSSNETDPVFIAHPAFGITGNEILTWDIAYNYAAEAHGWGNHANAGYLTSFTETDPVFGSSAAAMITALNTSNWNTAYGWGNHAIAGYLTGFTESDPLFYAHAASSITDGNITNWNTAVGWGNHAGLYEPFITKSTGFLKWNGFAWVFDNTAYLTSYNETDPVYGSSVASGITSTNVSNWNAAYGWGNHATVGYITSETDPAFISSAAHGITSTDISTWNSVISFPGFGTNHITAAYGDHTHSGFITMESDPVFISSAAFGVNPADISNWNSSYAWGNHAAAGYMTSFTETDPVFNSSIAQGITLSNTINWNAAYSWGNHATAGYLTSFTETDPVFAVSPAASITPSNTANWNTAFGWGNHALAGYLTTYTENDPVVRSLNGMIKSNGSNISVATPGTDYLTPTGSAALLMDFPILNQNTTGTSSNVTGIVSVSHGGTGNSSLTGYLKGNGSETLSASSSIPHTDISGLGSMSTQGSGSVSISGGNINGTAIGSTVQSSGAFTSLSANGNLTGNIDGTSTISNFSAAIIAKSSAYTLVAADNGKILLFDNSSDVNLTIPTLPPGFNCMVIQNGDGNVSFTPGSGITLNNRSGFTKTAGKYAIATIVAINATTFILSGDMQ